MVNVTLAVPEELHKLMRKHSEIKWSEIMRKAAWEQARKIELMDELVAGSKLSEEQAEEIGRKVKSALRKRYNK